MGSKGLLVLVMFTATILLISSEVAPNDFEENFDTKDVKHAANGVEESKFWGYGGYGGPWYGGYGGPWYGGYGGPWYGGYGGWHGGYGGWHGGYGGWRGGRRYGGWRSPHGHVENSIDANPRN
ncbi:nucleolar protein 3-like [Abrus precatorius]|uniref:Nucleolar protein 3-like n=1 Tax=Abrus precatorius TaxID=3816 RepID=A0A8B8M2F1_ABRPR|nr:nucleolar protein 3-like [Abrus precatorius]